MKKLIFCVFLLVYSLGCAQTTNPDLLVTLQKASQLEIDNYTNTELELGMLVYNTDEDRIFEYTLQGWVELLTASNVYVGAFQITAAGTVIVNNIPFQPSQIIFKANANIESSDIDTDNGIILANGGDNRNPRGITNSFGTINGFARRNSDNTISQQTIYCGSHGNSINDISRYASSSNCVGIRFGDQNGDSLGKIEASLTSFTNNGFTLNVIYTDGEINNPNANDPITNVQPTDINNEGLLVLFTAYK